MALGAGRRREGRDGGDATHTSDLGFGSQIATTRGERLIAKDGTFPIRRVGLGWRAVLSLYHSLITISWPAFLALVAVAYLGLHVLFGAAYVAAGDGALRGPGEGFERAFFFSVHTFSGIGYGHIVPETTLANWIATLEALTGMVGLALVAGIVFARFSRPTADVVASHTAVVAPYRGGLGLMVRVANQRRNQILGVRAQVLFSAVQQQEEKTTRTFDRLELERERIAVFPMSWTIVHPIDDDSPLAGHDAASLAACDGQILVLLEGTDETFAQTVHWRTSYVADEVQWGRRFRDIYERSDTGVPMGVDLGRIHQTEDA